MKKLNEIGQVGFWGVVAAVIVAVVILYVLARVF